MPLARQFKLKVERGGLALHISREIHMWQAEDEVLAASQKYPASGTQGQGEHGQRAAHVPLPQATPWFAAEQPAIRRVPAALLGDCCLLC
jgi:hypothetical protein